MEEKSHTFVVCAYKESPFLINCIESLLSQTKATNIVIATSTVNDFIKNTAQAYKLPLFVNENEAGIASDWNFAYLCAKTNLVTLAHQDDIYESSYLETALKYIGRAKSPLIFFSDYSEIRGDYTTSNNRLLKIKKLLLYPLSYQCGQKSRWVRRRILSFGNPICCPSVTYVREALPYPLFHSGMQSNIDWQTWEEISKLPGSFVYCNKMLVRHRIHSASTTSKIIQADTRNKEDLEVLYKFWPKAFAHLIEFFYSRSEKSNDL
jgi:Glycosyltransferases involved in cell wall biogenesis